MTQNALFNFIDNIILDREETKVNFSTCQRIDKTKNTDGENYIRFDLKNNNYDSICDNECSYSLQEHHISFYEEPRKGQYHYTAYFTDNESKRYRLHVYYNEYDELIEKSSVEFLIYNDGSDNSIYRTSDELSEKFINLANSKTASIMLQLREAHVRAIERLINDYNLQEKKSSSLSEKNNSKDHLESLKTTKAILEKLIILGGDSYYQKVKQLIECSISYIEKDIESIPTKKNKKSTLLAGEKENNNITKSQVSALNVGKSLQANQKKFESALHNELEKKIDRLMRKLSELNKISTKKQIIFLENTFSTFYQILLTINEDQELLSLVQKTTNLYKQLYRKGGELLCDLLTLEGMADRFELASQLVSFHEGLNVKLLGAALEAGEHEILDFILKYKKFPINSLSFTFQDSPNSVQDFYPSAVHFCYKTDYDDESMSECLSVLIKHGASTLVTDDRELPIAHMILSTPNHPLQKAFENNKEQTLCSASFYQKLIKSLKNYMDKNSLVGTEKQSMEEAIKKYQMNLRNIKLGQPAEETLKNIAPSMHSFFELKNTETIRSENNEERSINNARQ